MPRLSAVGISGLQAGEDVNVRERSLLGNTLSGIAVEPLVIKHLDVELERSDAGDSSELRDLAARVRGMSYAERVALVEAQGL